jgi:large subunit ribosomal protein L22
MPWSATHRFARISPRKARLVVDLIRGRGANEAMDLLKFTNKRASAFVRKVLKSAIANADSDKEEVDLEKLVVSEAQVDGGPTLKRMMPKDRGRAYLILKRTSHIRITVDQA